MTYYICENYAERDTPEAALEAFHEHWMEQYFIDKEYPQRQTVSIFEINDGEVIKKLTAFVSISDCGVYND